MVICLAMHMQSQITSLQVLEFYFHIYLGEKNLHIRATSHIYYEKTHKKLVY